MIKRIIAALLLLLIVGCSTGSNHTKADNRTEKPNTSSADSQQRELKLREVVTDYMKRRGVGEVRGLGVLDYVGDLLACRIVAVETSSEALTYLVVYDLEDKDGNEYLHAEPLNGLNRVVIDLVSGKKYAGNE